MSLKLIKRRGRRDWYVRGTVCGHSVYECTKTSNKEQAEGYRVKREGEIWQRHVYGARAVATFSEAVSSYLESKSHGGETIRIVAKLHDYFGRTPLSHIGQPELDEAYKVLLTKGAASTAATKRRSVLTPLNAILEHAAIRKWCERPAFQKPLVTKPRSLFLLPSDAELLIASASEHLRPLLIFLICTGARMAEALELDWKHVDLKGRQAVVWQKQQNERQIDLCPRVMAALCSLQHREGEVFLTPPKFGRDGRLKKAGHAYRSTFRTGGGQIKTAWATACRRAGFAGHWHYWTNKKGKEQKKWRPDLTPHALRHTWATWHYCLYQDLIRLRDEGGWSTITMVTRYSKKISSVYRDEIVAWQSGRPALLDKHEV